MEQMKVGIIGAGRIAANMAKTLDGMDDAAAYAIAGLVKEDELCPEFIIPNPLNKEVAPAVANAVKEAARKQGLRECKKTPKKGETVV